LRVDFCRISASEERPAQWPSEAIVPDRLPLIAGGRARSTEGAIALNQPRLQWRIAWWIENNNSQECAFMNTHGERLEPPDLSHYDENRSKFPLEELVKYAGKHIAFSLDGTRILASGDSIEEVEDQLIAAGINPNQVVGSYVDPPDITSWI
jgi:hypothetical protein